MSVIPKVYKPIFQNKNVKVNATSVTKYVIQINGNLYQPILDKTHKHVVVDKKIYVPVLKT